MFDQTTDPIVLFVGLWPNWPMLRNSLNFEVINYPSSRYFLCIKLSHSTRAIRNWTNSEVINLLHDLCGVLANHTIIQSHRQTLVNLSSLL